MTPKILSKALGIPMSRAQTWAPFMTVALQAAECHTVERAACFIGQIGHETGRLRYVRELWGPTAAQVRYERDFASPWPRSPEEARKAAFKRNRLAYTLGNFRSGYGKRYMGRGWIQMTGFTNYGLTTKRLRDLVGSDVPDFVVAPDMLCVPEWVALSAASYWRAKGLNAHCDSNDFLTLTKRINGGTNGLADRTALRLSALVALTEGA